MNEKIYSNAKRYVRSLRLEDPLDLLHDAYVKWYDKTGTDLFDEPEYRVYAIIKYTFKAHLKMGDWNIGGKDSYNGKKMKKFITPKHTSKRRYSTFNDGSSFTSSSDYYEQADKCEMTTPLDILIAKETKDRYVNLAVDENSLKILELKAMGLRNSDIADQWDVSRAMVTWYLRKVDQKSILN